MTNTTIQERVYELTKDLRESTGKRKQNFTSLTTSKGYKVLTYCAIGAIGCAKGIIGFAKNPDYGVESSFSKDETQILKEPPYKAIINIYGIEDKLTKPAVLSYYRDGNQKYGLEHSITEHLSDLIPTLNDSGHWSYDEIADFLDVLVDNSFIKTCSQKKIKDTQRFLLEKIED